MIDLELITTEPILEAEIYLVGTSYEDHIVDYIYYFESCNADYIDGILYIDLSNIIYKVPLNIVLSWDIENERKEIDK